MKVTDIQCVHKYNFSLVTFYKLKKRKLPQTHSPFILYYTLYITVNIKHVK